MTTTELTTQTIARITSIIRRQQQPNDGFLFNAIEGEIGRIVSVNGSDAIVEYPRRYTLKDGSVGIYTVRDCWSAFQARKLMAKDARWYDAGLWTTWDAQLQTAN